MSTLLSLDEEKKINLILSPRLNIVEEEKKCTTQ